MMFSPPLAFDNRSASAPIATNAPFGLSNPVFPSIVIKADSLTPQGSFAAAQTQYLDPDIDEVSSLAQGLEDASMGIVAHYYMDVELQSILTAVATSRAEKGLYKNVVIADSLMMGDAAVQMARDGATSIACLGVDFMAESVQAILAQSGFGHIPVYRSTAKSIGCSLAASAENLTYLAWLTKAKESSKNPLHVIYINTSLETKANTSNIIPTITCTSSNVMATILQAGAQVSDIDIYYGPDTYMGYNLQVMLDRISDTWSDEQIKTELHASHDKASIASLRKRLHVYPSGNCVVHHMFGADVVKTVKAGYADAFYTAHLEVPGEMFELAMAASLEQRGVVGSTSNILNFITDKVTEETERRKAEGVEGGEASRLKFVLGTEAGMVTSIVKNVQKILEASGKNSGVEAEIIFPVASEAMSIVDEASGDDSGLSIVPGVSGAEGCSTAGGCATCPFMKMNDIDSLQSVVKMVVENGAEEKNKKVLDTHLPPQRLAGKVINGRDAVEVGVEPILDMREFMLKSVLSEKLINRVMTNDKYASQ
jgi:quinolinate synthase